MRNKLIDLYGWVGVSAVFGAYLLISFGAINPRGLVYQAINLFGALGILIEAFSKKDYQPAILNLIWALVAVASIIIWLK